MTEFDQAKAALRENLARAPYLSQWRHLKSGGEYTIIVHVLREADLTPEVVYHNRDADEIETWTRPASEFFDGRFGRID